MLWLGITLIFCFLQVLMTPLFPLPDFSGLQAAAQIPSFLPVFLSQDLGSRQRLLTLSQFDSLILNPAPPTPSHLCCVVIVTRNPASERGPLGRSKGARSLAEPGPPIYPRWLFGTWPAAVYSLVKGKSQGQEL